MTLSAIVTLIIESFLPETYQKYLFLNYKQLSQYRSYKSFIHVPEFLHGRPRSVIIHCLERRSRSLKYTTEDVCLISDDEGTFTVKGSNSNHHCVSFGMNSTDTTPSCTCRDWVQWHIPCKHFWAVFRFYPAWYWARFPESYQRSAYLSTDTGALDTFFNDSPANISDDLQDGASKSTTPGEDHTSSSPADEIPDQQVHTKLIIVTCLLLHVQ